MSTPTSAHLPHVVVLGAGFGGLTFAKAFDSSRARVTVIDRQNHHVFQPLLYQVATAGLSAPDIAQPIRHILRDKPNLTVLLAEVQRIDLAARRIEHDQGTIDFDYLVLALGGETSYFGRDEWSTFAPGLKSLDDAMRLRRNMLLAYERAELENDPQRRRELMTTVVIGGGPTGVELAGTFAELARTVLWGDFDRIDPRDARIVLIEGSDRVLANFPADLSASAQRQLEKLGVEVRLGTRVTALRASEVEIGGETLRAGNIVWAAGVRASPVTAALGVDTDRSGRIKVRPDFSLPGHPRVFAIGDLAALSDANGCVVPGVCQGAMQAGSYVAQVIGRELAAGPGSPPARAPFAYSDRGNMATIGRSKAVAQIGPLHFSGWLAWVMWLGLHLVFLMGFRNRLSVFMHWMYSYFTYKRGARIITGLGGRPRPGGSAPASLQPVR